MLYEATRRGFSDDQNATLVSEGTVRYWDYYVPDGLPPKAPVVVVLHGGGQNKDQILDPLRVSPAKEWLQIADEHKVIIAIPNGVNVTTGLGAGTNLSWNDARSDNLTNSAGYAYSLWAMWADGRDDPNDARADLPIMANAAKNGAPHVFAAQPQRDRPVAQFPLALP